MPDAALLDELLYWWEMDPQPLVCPYCRVWFEGSGRSVRCTGCGRRVNVAEARIGAASKALAEPDRSVFSQPDSVDWPDEHEATWSPAETQTQTRSDTDSAEGQSFWRSLDFGWILTLGVIPLILVASRVLDERAVFAIIGTLFLVRWLLGQSRGGRSQDEDGPQDGDTR